MSVSAKPSRRRSRDVSTRNACAPWMDIGLGMRHEVQRILLLRPLEQHAGANVLAAGLRMQRPGRVTQREIELGRVRGLVGEPARDVRREGELVEASAEMAAQLALERAAVERLRILRRDARRRPSLHELALDLMERRQLVVAVRQRRHFVHDAEELSDEPLEVRRDVEDQRRLVLRGDRVRNGACREQALAQRGIRRTEELQERAVDRALAIPPVEVGEGDAETRRELGFRVAGGGLHKRVHVAAYNASRAVFDRVARMSSPRNLAQRVAGEVAGDFLAPVEVDVGVVHRLGARWRPSCRLRRSRRR